MGRLFLAVALVSAASSPVVAKGETELIRIGGPTLAAPVESREPEALSRFTLRVHGFIVDWEAGVAADVPESAARFDVEFVVRRGGDERRTYRVVYAVDPSTGRGFVYLPSGSDPSIEPVRRWFHASAEWDRFAARTFIPPAPSTRRGGPSGPRVAP